MDKNLILEKYNKKILGIGGLKKYYSHDFENKDKLISFLYELTSFEVDLTDDGLNFLKEYYGLDQIVNFIKDSISKGIEFGWQKKSDIIAWLERKGDFQPDAIFIKYNEDQKIILKKYVGKIVAKKSIPYEDRLLINVDEEKYYANYFTNPNYFINFLKSIQTLNAKLNPTGLEFLKEYYGLDKLAEIVLKEEDLKDQFKNKEKFIEWLKDNVEKIL